MVDKFELEMEKSRELGEDETRLGPQQRVDFLFLYITVNGIVIYL